MKKLLAICLITGFAAPVLAQEYDDMYFRARDRKRPATSEPAFVSNYENFKRQHFPETAQETINPTDSYSARQLNPEFSARSLSDVATADEENYFVENFRPSSTASVPFNNSYYFNNPWNNPWGMGWYSSAWARPWQNPWYWGYYDPWMNPWMNPWMPGGGWGWTPGWNYGFNSLWAPGFSGWTVSVGYSWGNAWGNAWCSPYWNSWGMWNNWGIWNRPVFWGWGNEIRNVNYGKRYSQTNAVAGDVRQHYTTSPRQANPNSNINTSSPSGRTRGDNNEYYVPPARRSAPVRQGTNTLRDTDYQQRTPARQWNNNPDFNRSPGNLNNSRPSYSIPSRSSGSFSPGGGARPSAPSGGGRRGGQ
jgi:hypothetical protein